MIYSNDLLATVARGELFVLDDILRPALKLSTDTPLTSALREFKQGRNHLALIVDASARVRGLLTIQDVLEAIAGKR
jgi:magnesium and cobalt transporter